MNREEFAALDDRIEARATRLWLEAGSPDGGHARYLDQARELVALGEVELPTLGIEEATRPVIEEATIQSNLGEFPTLRDQGDEMTFPDPAPDDDPYAEDDIRLSDGDASETGGVLPDEDVPGEDLPEVSLDEADVTASSLDADDDLPNDDGAPDDGATSPEGNDEADDDKNDRISDSDR